jgi:hypothetical protein
MEGRGFLVLVVFLAGIGCAVGITIVTDACRAHLDAAWLARSGSGPPAHLPVWCLPSQLASAHALAFLMITVRVAIATGGLAVVALIARGLVGAERSLRVRRIAGWVNLGALAVMMAAAVGIAGSGEGEVRFYSIPWLLIGCAPAAVGSFTGARKPPSAFSAP